MRVFQKLVQKAISEKASRLRLSANNSPAAVSPEGPLLWKDEGIFAEKDILELFKIFFPQGVEKPEKGTWDIPNVGKILLIAEKHPSPTLRLYFPSGHDMFEEAWKNLNMAIPKEAKSQNINPPPPVGLASPSTEEKLDITSPPPTAGLTAASKNPNPVIPQAGVIPFAAPSVEKNIDISSQDAKTPDPIGGAFIPSGLSDTSSVAENLSVAPVPKEEEPPVSPPQNLFESPTELPSNLFSSPSPEKSPQQQDHSEINAQSSDVQETPTIKEEKPEPLLSPTNPPSQTEQPLQVVKNVIEPSSESLLKDMKIVYDLLPNEKIHRAGNNEIDTLLRKMLEIRASDMHITVGEPLAFRIDGEIIREGAELSPEEFEKYIDPIIPPANKGEFIKDNDTDFAYEIPEVARFRVNLFRCFTGVGAVLRHIPSKILTADDLNLPEAIRNFCMLSKGLVVVTGPTGSGKSTTLAAMVDLINKSRKEHILTVEDPIEFVHSQQNCLVTHREVKRHTKSFGRALKAALREDPDIILIGELRDLETTAIAIEVAETGHLVMGTLHTTTAISTVDRIIDQFSADQQEQIRTMLASSLKGVVAQTLLRKIGGGRVAAHEILVVNQAVSSNIREANTHFIQNAMVSNKAEGNVLLNESLIKYVKEGIVEPKEAWIKAIDKKDFMQRIHANNIKF